MPDTPLRSIADPGIVTTRQGTTPAGVPAIFKGRFYGVAFGATSDELLVTTDGAFYRMNWRKNELLQRQDWKGTPGLQSVAFDGRSGKALTVIEMESKSGEAPHLELFGLRDGSSTSLLSDLGFYNSGAIAFAAQARLAAIPLIHDNQLAIVDLEHNTLVRKIATSIAPFGAAFNAKGTVAYVTNWGGRVAKPGDKTAASGEEKKPEDPKPAPDRVVIDARGVAATGTVTRIDIESGKATDEIPVGLHPTATLWDEPRHRVYVANSNDDSVSVIDTATNKVLRTIALQPFAQRVNRIASTALALTTDGSKLFVACGGINAVAQINTTGGAIEGLIPAGWYPASLTGVWIERLCLFSGLRQLSHRRPRSLRR